MTDVTDRFADQPVAVLVGCSGGIGEAIARALADAGVRVFGTSRSGESTAGGAVTPLAMDVTDEASVRVGIERVVHDTGRLDILIHNAGVTLFGAVEETTSAEAQHMLDVNLLGVHRVVRAALPHLRHRRGRVVLIGSLAGFLTLPHQVWYAVAKHGLDAYAETLRFEVREFGVRVTLLEPGFVRTDLARHAASVAEPVTIYDGGRRGAERRAQRDLGGGVPAGRVGSAVARVIQQERPPLRVLVGPDAHRLNLVRRLLPDRWFERGSIARFSRPVGRRPG